MSFAPELFERYRDKLATLGLRLEHLQSVEALPDPKLVLARVIEQHRSHFVLALSASEQRQARAHPKLKRGDNKVTVGDFVWLNPDSGDFAEVLPRLRVLKRAAAGERYAEQVLAANIDCAILVCGLDRDYSPRRIERYLTLVLSASVRAVVVLSKADSHPDAQAEADHLRQRLGNVDVFAMDNRSLEQASLLKQVLLAGESAVLLGSSGAGKSTLSNTLIELSLMATQSVRESDGRGRHTTVHRALLCLPWGACLIDCPGLREIKLTGFEDLDQDSFADIAKLAQDCRFRDCQHQREPGCAVLQAIEDESLDPDRLENYFKLRGERENARNKAMQKDMGSSKRR